MCCEIELFDLLEIWIIRKKIERRGSEGNYSHQIISRKYMHFSIYTRRNYLICCNDTFIISKEKTFVIITIIKSDIHITDAIKIHFVNRGANIVRRRICVFNEF